jgi:BioD-like phosphotransacetylase family protein
MLAAADTVSTLERAEEVIRSGRTRDERTVAVMSDLLRAHADLDALLGAV